MRSQPVAGKVPEDLHLGGSRTALAWTPDGQRFYTTQAIPTPPPPPVTYIHLVQNWLEEVKDKETCPITGPYL